MKSATMKIHLPHIGYTITVRDIKHYKAEGLPHAIEIAEKVDNNNAILWLKYPNVMNGILGREYKI